jgi:hypothetical protein
VVTASRIRPTKTSAHRSGVPLSGVCRAATYSAGAVTSSTAAWPHRPRPSVVRRVLRQVNPAGACMGFGFFGAVLVTGCSLLTGGLWLLGGVPGLVVFRRGVRLSPRPSSEDVETSKVEWF